MNAFLSLLYLSKRPLLSYARPFPLSFTPLLRSLPYFSLAPLSPALLAVGESVQHERRGPHGTTKGGEEQDVGLELFGRYSGVRPARGEHRLRGGWRCEAARRAREGGRKAEGKEVRTRKTGKGVAMADEMLDRKQVSNDRGRSRKKPKHFFFSADEMSDNREEENAAATFDDGDGSPAGGLGNLLGSYRSDSGEEDAGRGEEEAPESVRDDGEEAAAAAAAATTCGAAPPPPPPPPPPQPAAPPPPPPQAPHQNSTPQKQQQQEEKEQQEEEKEQERRRREDPLWLPSSLARRPGADGRGVDPALASKVRRMLAASAAGRSLSAELRRSRAYRNPYFLEKMVAHLGLDPRASWLRAPGGCCCEGEGREGGQGKPRPSSFSIPKEDTADALELEEAAARRAASSAVTGRVEFVREGGGGARRGRRWD